MDQAISAKKHVHLLWKATAIFLLIFFTLLSTTEYVYASSLVSPEALTVTPFEIPSEYVSLDSSYTGTNEKTILFMQDAHNSLDAQENIAKAISHLVASQTVQTVLEEGYEGKVPTEKYFGFIENREVREKVSYFLMDKLRVSGAEYAHINREKDFNLIGADSISLHKENIEWYRAQSEQREEIEREIKVIQKEIKKLANRYFPHDLKKWMKAKEKFDAGKIDLVGYLREMIRVASDTLARRPRNDVGYLLIHLILAGASTKHTATLEQINSIDSKALFSEIDRLEEDLQTSLLSNERDQKIFDYYKALQLIGRLSNIEISANEFQAVKERIESLNLQELAQFIANERKKSIVITRSWKAQIQNAIAFYETAQKRDEALANHLSAFTSTREDDVAVLVYGGFHRSKIEEILKRQGFSFHILSPKVKKIEKRHQDYYKQIMSEGYHDFEAPLHLATAVSPERVHNLSNGLAVVELVRQTVLTNPTASLKLLDRFLLNPSGSNRAEVRTDEEKKDVRFTVHPILDANLTAAERIEKEAGRSLGADRPVTQYSGKEGYRGVLFRVDGKPVGFAILRLYQSRLAAEVISITMLPDFQDRGIEINFLDELLSNSIRSALQNTWTLVQFEMTLSENEPIWKFDHLRKFELKSKLLRDEFGEGHDAYKFTGVLPLQRRAGKRPNGTSADESSGSSRAEVRADDKDVLRLTDDDVTALEKIDSTLEQTNLLLRKPELKALRPHVTGGVGNLRQTFTSISGAAQVLNNVVPNRQMRLQLLGEAQKKLQLAVEILEALTGQAPESFAFSPDLSDRVDAHIKRTGGISGLVHELQEVITDHDDVRIELMKHHKGELGELLTIFRDAESQLTTFLPDLISRAEARSQVSKREFSEDFRIWISKNTVLPHLGFGPTDDKAYREILGDVRRIASHSWLGAVYRRLFIRFRGMRMASHEFEKLVSKKGLVYGDMGERSFHGYSVSSKPEKAFSFSFQRAREPAPKRDFVSVVFQIDKAKLHMAFSKRIFEIFRDLIWTPTSEYIASDISWSAVDQVYVYHINDKEFVDVTTDVFPERTSRAEARGDDPKFEIDAEIKGNWANREFLEETIEKLNLPIDDNDIAYVRNDPRQGWIKDVYRIHLLNRQQVDIASFILYRFKKETLAPNQLEAYQRGDQFRRSHPDFKRFPRVGGVRQISDRNLFWMSVEDGGRIPIVSDLERVLDVYVDVAAAGWALTDPKLSQIAISPKGPGHDLLVDLDFTYALGGMENGVLVGEDQYLTQVHNFLVLLMRGYATVAGGVDIVERSAKRKFDPAFVDNARKFYEANRSEVRISQERTPEEVVRWLGEWEKRIDAKRGAASSQMGTLTQNISRLADRHEALKTRYALEFERTGKAREKRAAQVVTKLKEADDFETMTTSHSNQADRIYKRIRGHATEARVIVENARHDVDARGAIDPRRHEDSAQLTKEMDYQVQSLIVAVDEANEILSQIEALFNEIDALFDPSASEGDVRSEVRSTELGKHFVYKGRATGPLLDRVRRLVSRVDQHPILSAIVSESLKEVPEDASNKIGIWFRKNPTVTVVAASGEKRQLDKNALGHIKIRADQDQKIHGVHSLVIDLKQAQSEEEQFSFLAHELVEWAITRRLTERYLITYEEYERLRDYNVQDWMTDAQLWRLRRHFGWTENENTGLYLARTLRRYWPRVVEGVWNGFDVTEETSSEGFKQLVVDLKNLFDTAPLSERALELYMQTGQLDASVQIPDTEEGANKAILELANQLIPDLEMLPGENRLGAVSLEAFAKALDEQRFLSISQYDDPVVLREALSTLLPNWLLRLGGVSIYNTRSEQWNGWTIDVDEGDQRIARVILQDDRGAGGNTLYVTDFWKLEGKGRGSGAFLIELDRKLKQFGKSAGYDRLRVRVSLGEMDIGGYALLIRNRAEFGYEVDAQDVGLLSFVDEYVEVRRGKDTLRQLMHKVSGLVHDQFIRSGARTNANIHISQPLRSEARTLSGNRIVEATRKADVSGNIFVPFNLVVGKRSELRTQFFALAYQIQNTGINMIVYGADLSADLKDFSDSGVQIVRGGLGQAVDLYGKDDVENVVVGTETALLLKTSAQLSKEDIRFLITQSVDVHAIPLLLTSDDVAGIVTGPDGISRVLGDFLRAKLREYKSNLIIALAA